MDFDRRRILPFGSAEVMSEYITVSCDKCSTGLRVRGEYAGRRVACRNCQNVFTVPTPPTSRSGDSLIDVDRAQATAPDHVMFPTTAPADVVRFECPKCAKRLKMRGVQVGARVTCSGCQHVFATSFASSSPGQATQTQDLEERIQAVEGEWKQRVERLETENTRLREQSDRLGQEIEVTRSDLDAAGLEVNSLRSALERGETEAASRSKYQGLRESTAARLVSLREQVNELETLRAQDLKAHELEIARWKADAETARQETLEASLSPATPPDTSALDALHVELTELRQLLDRNQTEHEAEVTRLTQQVDDARREANDAALRPLQNELTELQRLRDQDREDHETKISALTLQVETARLEARESALGPLQAELDELRANRERDLAEHKSEFDRLIADAEAARLEVDRLQTESQSLRDAFDAERASLENEWRTRWDSSRVEADEARADAESARKEIDDLRSLGSADLDTARAELSRLQVAFESLTIEHSHHHDDREHLRAETVQLNQVLESSRNELQRLTDSQAEIKQALSDEIERLRSDNILLSEKIEELHADLAREQSVRDTDRKDFEARISEFQAENAQLRSAGADRHSYETVSLRAIDELRSPTDAFLSEVFGEPSSTSVKVDEDHPLLGRLRDELASKDAEIDDLREMVRQAQTYKAQMGTFLSGLGIRLPSA